VYHVAYVYLIKQISDLVRAKNDECACIL
jgi:hypothetical protein